MEHYYKIRLCKDTEWFENEYDAIASLYSKKSNQGKYTLRQEFVTS
jgi:hypothetical protein